MSSELELTKDFWKQFLDEKFSDCGFHFFIIESGVHCCNNVNELCEGLYYLKGVSSALKHCYKGNIAAHKKADWDMADLLGVAAINFKNEFSVSNEASLAKLDSIFQIQRYYTNRFIVLMRKKNKAIK